MEGEVSDGRCAKGRDEENSKTCHREFEPHQALSAMP